MGTTLRVFFLCLMWAGILGMQFNFEMDTTATRKLKNALELGLHDAALAIDINQLQQGKIVFERVQAEANVRSSLQQNLSLNSSLEPLTDSFFKSKLEIKAIEFYDATNTVSYPFNYSNPTYNVLDIIDGPAIVLIVETKSPRYFAGEPMTIRQGVVYEYKKF